MAFIFKLKLEDGTPAEAPHRLLAPVSRSANRAEGGGRLRDHRLGATPKDEVVIEVSLAAIQRDRGDDAVDAPVVFLSSALAPPMPQE